MPISIDVIAGSPRLLELTQITNLRLFKDSPTVEGRFPVPEPDQGQWIVVVGENGVGKTTLLRALGLALADPNVATRLLDENQPFVRNGGDGRIAIALDTGRVEVLVKREARTETVVSGGGDVRRPWVVGYGVRRGNARGGKDRAHEFGPTGELHTLFDRPAALVNAVKWLLDLDRCVLNEDRQYGRAREGEALRPHAACWASVVRALCALLGVTAVEPDVHHVMVTHPQFGRVRLDALGDGYLTTTGWAVDLIARWVQRQEEIGEVVGSDLLRQMTGIVLIDEIDLHLHPIWQMKIIEDVRRLFPRLSFVVTTHNALTLHGARPGEIFVMRRGQGGIIEFVQRDIRPGHDVDRVLFEQFGIWSTLDRDTRDLLRHRLILEAGRSPSDPERVELERRIRERLGRVGEVLREERSEVQDPTAPWSMDPRDELSQLALQSVARDAAHDPTPVSPARDQEELQELLQLDQETPLPDPDLDCSCTRCGAPARRQTLLCSVHELAESQAVLEEDARHQEQELRQGESEGDYDPGYDDRGPW